MFLSQFTLQSPYPVGPHDCWETVSFKGFSFTYCIMVLHFSDILCQLPSWLLLSEHNGMQVVGLDDEASLWDDSDMVSLECKVSKQQQRLFKPNNHFPKSCCHLKCLCFFLHLLRKHVYLFWALSAIPLSFCSWIVYSSVYFCLTVLKTVFHRWCSPVIKGGWIQTALLELSHQTDRINNCCQRLANTQLAFFICEFSSSPIEVTLHCSVTTFERLHLRSGFTFSFIRCYEADRERNSHICLVFISLSLSLWLSSPAVIPFPQLPHFSVFYTCSHVVQLPRAYSMRRWTVARGDVMCSLSCLGLASRPVARLCCISNRLRSGC